MAKSMQSGTLMKWVTAVAVVGVVGAWTPAGLAATDSCAEPRKADGGMNEAVYRGVEQVTKLLSENKTGEAIDKLSKMANENMTAYEKAVVYYNLGYAYSLKNDNKNAAAAFQKAVDQNSLPQTQHEQLLYNTGQLYVIDHQLDKGISILERYLVESCSEIPADAHVFLASAYADKKRMRDALGQIDQALLKSDKPKESWLQTKLAIHFELGEFQACADTLVRMLSMTPQKPDYWKQLSSIFFELKDEPKAVATLALAERQGFVSKPAEIKNLYSMYMMLEVPLKAGQLMREAMDKGRMPRDEANLDALANAWINAKEHSEAEKILLQLAESTKKGDYYYKLGAMYGDNERWDDSIAMLRKATASSMAKNQGDAWMRLAVAYYNKDDLNQTEAALVKASGFDNTRKQAADWLSYVRQSKGG